MSKQGVLLGAFYSCHMLRARPRCVWVSATRQATTTSNADGRISVRSSLQWHQRGRDLKLSECQEGMNVQHILCLMTDVAVKVSIKARVQG